MKQRLSATYDPTDIEPGLYESWAASGYFHPEAADADAPYTIVIPPPNVTAALHMGHALNNTIQDVLIRWRRMQGRDALWIPGTDHAGIATQNVIERNLAEEGLTRWDLGREAFVERVWEWVDEYGSRIIGQLKAIGCSCDWERIRFTFDEGLSRAVREVFVRLYEKDLLYRDQYIINWCPRCGTALSNEEAEHHEQTGRLTHIRYPFAEEPSRHLVVATTRPETMLGDTAVAVHPDDERYRELIGRELLLPLVGRRIPVIADGFVDPEFGTGAVKVTPAHDPNDFEMAERHELPRVDILTDDAEISEEAPEAYRGLDRFEARARVVEDLEAEGLVEAVEEHTHSVGRCYRCDTIVEPRLSLQWFVRMEPLAEPALEAYRDGRLRFHPERHGATYEHWMENIRDWCISRQIWWGHRIPVWYCQAEACGGEFAAREDPDACPECGGEVVQDPDVLDTWFSSWLWPFSTLGWPEETEDLRVFYPTNALSTAPDILFFWVARMVMAGLEFMEELPFTDVLLHSTVRDPLNRAMSKSLGNGIDPLEVVELFGADAMRYTLMSKASVGTDFQLDPDDLEASFRPGRNFANKIWNAARLALPELSEEDVAADPMELDLEMADRWILSRFRAEAGAATETLERFRLHELAQGLHRFVWGDFCDWYLELAKPRLRGERGEESRRAAAGTLARVLEGSLRLLHPIMPFLTEALVQRLPGRTGEDTVMLGPWPSPPATWTDADAERGMEQLQELVGTVRNLRSEYHVDAGRRVEVRLASVPDPLGRALREEEQGVRTLARVSRVRTTESTARDVPGAHAVLVSGTELFLPLEDVIDLDRERERLSEEMERVESLLTSTRDQLSNEGFLTQAPEEVVERAREREVSLERQRERLVEKRDALGENGAR